jgi:preprotein translocase subunit SecA
MNDPETARKNVANEISVSLGEYLEDYDDPKTWKIDSLVKWAMSAFQVSLSASKVRQMSAEEIEETFADAACRQVDKKDTSRLTDFSKRTTRRGRLSSGSRPSSTSRLKPGTCRS